ncbi:esterase/lipase family protein [Streptomyces sp. NPDC055099]
MRSRVAGVVAALLLGLAAPTWAATPSSAAPSAAAPAPGDGKNDTVYFIKGYTPDRAKCTSKWNGATRAMRSWGWTGKIERVGLYAADTRRKGCTVNLLDPRPELGTVDVPIKDLGKALAWNIYNKYSSRGKSVDLVGHSMGGLIARAAIAGFQRHEEGWPPRLYVEDVVTLGTPHKGALSVLDGDRQSRDMRPWSDFISWLNKTPNPQAEGGTDWTVIGSEFDVAVGMGSATPTDSGFSHVVRYDYTEGISHSQLRTTTRGTYYLSYRNQDAVWHDDYRAVAPVRAAWNALYWARKW